MRLKTKMSEDVKKSEEIQLKKLIKESVNQLSELVGMVNQLRSDLKSTDKVRQANAAIVTHLIKDSINKGLLAQQKHLKEQLLSKKA